MNKLLLRQLFTYLRICVIGLGMIVAPRVNAATATIDWLHQFGTSAIDANTSAASDALGNIYLAGGTTGSFGDPNLGDSDAFLTKFSSDGDQQWSKQIGTSSFDSGEAVSADGMGNIVIAGATSGALAGASAGGTDAILVKFDSAGNLLWTRQFGSVADDGAIAAAADNFGNVYISGSTRGNLGGQHFGSEDAFIAKYDTAGNLQWIKQQGSDVDERSHGLAVDNAGNVFTAGPTFGDLVGMSSGAIDGFLTRYDLDGNLIWSKQFGTSAVENVLGVSADGSGNVYLVGQTFGSLGGPHAGSSDVFVVKYDLSGNQQWARQLGTPGLDVGTEIDTDEFGNVFISGMTTDGLDGTNAGGYDAFVSKLDAAGNWVWTKQIGTNVDDKGSGITKNAVGGVFVSGQTDGVLGDSSAGGIDVFLLRISEVPEPTALLQIVVVGVGILVARRR